jgi:hypothetical protein
MKKLITIVLLFIGIIVYSQNEPYRYRIYLGVEQYNKLQTEYVEGTVILLNGDKINGFINRDLSESKLNVIVGNDTVKYIGNEIIEFEYKSQSKIISRNIDSKYLFLQIIPIEKGKINAYTYDQILIEKGRSSGANFFSNSTEYNRVVEVYFEKNGIYTKLTSNDDVYFLIFDDNRTMEYIKELGEIELNNLDKILHIIEFYNMSVNN